jgi:hypothetical protein
VLRLLHRRVDHSEFSDTDAAQAVYETFKRTLAQYPIIPTKSGAPIPIPACVVPPLVPDPSVGEAFRGVLHADATHGDKVFPCDRFCGGELAHILVDHGAHELTPSEAAIRLAMPDPDRSTLKEHFTAGVFVDPVLSVLEGLWSGFDLLRRDALVQSVRRQPLFPVSQESGRVTRIATVDFQCFYPPRSLKGDVGLAGLCFFLQDLCWGALNPKERNELLAKEMPIWQALFELHEFKFPDVMRASVLPALDLDSDASDRRRSKLRSLESLAEICQLAGRVPDASKPLPYERLGPNRALFNLSRLDVPCRSDATGDIRWIPAYRAYLGEDWVGEASFERVCKAIAAVGADAPDVDFLVSPIRFVGLLDRFGHLKGTTAEDSGDVGADEVGIDEDDAAGSV